MQDGFTYVFFFKHKYYTDLQWQAHHATMWLILIYGHSFSTFA